MQHLLSAWNEVEPVFRERALMLFLDFDGTLTPIVRQPRLAKLSRVKRKFLQELAAQKEIKTAIVSGRSLADLKKRVGVSGFLYAGNHGLEVEGPSLHFAHPEALTARKLMQKLTVRLKAAFKLFPAVFVENKVFTLSVHYRELASGKLSPARAVFFKVLAPYLNASKVVMTEGKKVWEIRPSHRWNKGTLVLWLLARVIETSSKKVLPIYVGDDRTDEDAFKALRRKGMGVKVIEAKEDGPTEALYSLRSSAEVFDFLGRLKALKNSKRGIQNRASVRAA